MPESSSRERDLVLAPNEFAFISDQTKGLVNVYVGPYKTSLANTDQPVIFNEKTKRFERCSLEEAIQVFAIAPEGWYIILKNPAKDGSHPKPAFSNNLIDLEIGHKVNIPGPTSFALWPGQMIRIVQGHTLHYNQYLLVRVYNEDAARKNWDKSIIRAQTKKPSNLPTQSQTQEDDIIKPNQDPPTLSTGKILMVQGTDVSFYIPPTGIEVLRDDSGEYVREAVTLERLEYCILLDEDGNKRYVRGPAVVFPKPSEKFVEKNGQKKFRAIELNEISGIYIKVIAPYKEDGYEYKEGEELFITGKQQMIYFPRPEHAIIKYGDQEIHYAVAIPAGEGRYCLNRLTGKISLIKGPTMYLPDPRYEVIVRRVLEPQQVELWFPGNKEALEYNLKLKELAKLANYGENIVPEQNVKRALSETTHTILENYTQHKTPKVSLIPPSSSKEQSSSIQHVNDKETSGIYLPSKQPPFLSESIVSDDFVRKTSYTPPRTLILDTKYEGAVSIDVWTGYAVLVVSKSGNRKVIVGPQTYLLEYDEYLEPIELSTGTPKSNDKKIKTVYLRVLHNIVSDIVKVETKDLCNVSIHLSYKVNFEGNPERWFNVENYVKFLTDHMRSLLRHIVKQYGVEEFYNNSIKIIRDAVVGLPIEGNKRPGRYFEENGMKIYDLDILDVKVGDISIENLIVEAQHNVVKQTIELANERRREEFIKQTEELKQKIAEYMHLTKIKEINLSIEQIKQQLILELAEIQKSIDTRKIILNSKLAEQELLTAIERSEISRKRENFDLEIEVQKRKLELELQKLEAEVNGLVEKAKAITPDMVSALQAFSDKDLATKLAQSMSPLAILGGKSVVDVFAQLVKGTPVEKLISQNADSNSNN